jgi:hypothetical protein
MNFTTASPLSIRTKQIHPLVDCSEPRRIKAMGRALQLYLCTNLPLRPRTSPRNGNQILPKTVLRAGWGVSYALTPSFNYPPNGIGVGFNTLNFTSSAYGLPAVVLSQGQQYSLAALNDASYNPAIVPSPGQINGPPYIIDRNAGRPGRVNQWNISLQRELTKDLLLEAAFVGNVAAGEWSGNLQPAVAGTSRGIRAEPQRPG